MKADDIIAKIREALPDAVVEMQDLTGTEDHWQAKIVSGAFAGKSLIQRHRLIMAALAEEMKGPIHALTMDLKTPDEAGIALSKAQDDFWASKTGQKLLRDRVERCFPEFISRVPSKLLSEAGLKRHYKDPEPVKRLRVDPA